MEFEFNQNNVTEISLPVLSQADSTGNKHFPPIRESRRNKGIVQLGFFGEDSCWEYENQWTALQLETLDFIKSNQHAILQSLFEYTKNTLYPQHIEYIGFDEVSFPALNQLPDLRQGLAVHFVCLYREGNVDTAFYALQCDFSGDYGHGTNLIMNKTEVLGWEENLGKDLILQRL